MRKLLIALMLVLLCLSTAQAADFSPSVILDRVSNSLVRVRTKRIVNLSPVPITGYSGSGFIVAADKKETIVVTARHVVEDPQVKFFEVLLGEVAYNTTIVKKIPDVDAAYLIFRPGIKGARALKFNLYSTDSNVDAICFGFALFIHSRNEAPKPTFTVGKVSRKVCAGMWCGPEEYLKGILFGTPTLLFGYSGGVCTDLEYNVIGVNIAINDQMCVFTDGRVLWNGIPELNKGSQVKVPYDAAFHVSNIVGESRIPTDEFSSITLKDGTQPLEPYLKKLFGSIDAAKESALSIFFGSNIVPTPESAKAWIKPDTYFTINHKKYVIYLAKVSLKGYQGYINKITFRDDEKHYIYLCDRGWEVQITLDEVDDAVISKINETWKAEKEAKPVK